MQIVQIGTQLTEALAGLERTHEILAEQPEDRDPTRVVELPLIHGDLDFERVSFSYDAEPVKSCMTFHSTQHRGQ